MRFKELREKYYIFDEDIWNFDETGFRIGIARSDFILSTDPIRRIYSSDPDNRESLSSQEAINGVGQSIPPMLIIQGQQILARWFMNNLANDILITTSPSGVADDWISLQWVKHFNQHSKKKQKGVYRLLIFDGYGSHTTKELLEYCELNNIIPLALPSHTTHLLQPLDV